MYKLKAFLRTLVPMSDKEFEDVRSYAYEMKLKKGDLLHQQGKICKHLFFINRGSFRTFYLNEKAEEITHCFRTEMSFVTSYKSFILQEPSFLSVMALEDSELAVIDYDKLQKLYSENILWQKVGRLLAERAYIEMEQYGTVLNNENAKEKYLRLQSEQSEVFQKASMEHIASYLGVTRRTVSRIRQEISL